MQKLDYVNILIYFKESTMSTYDRKSRRAKLLRIYKLSLSERSVELSCAGTMLFVKVKDRY